MVGGPRAGLVPLAVTRAPATSVLRDEYDSNADAYAAGPEQVYDTLARAFVAGAAVSIRDATVADLGCGTGALSRAIHAAGGIPFGIDLSRGMIVHNTAAAARVLGDVLSVPLRSESVDVAASAFVLSHLAMPEHGLAEAARVTKRGGAVIASVFGSGAGAALKERVDGAARRFGWVPPEWHVRLKTELEPLTNETAALADRATAAGLEQVRVIERTVDLAFENTDEVVRWRLGMPHLAPFIRSLAPDLRADLRIAAREAIGPDLQPIGLPVLILSSRVAA